MTTAKIGAIAGVAALLLGVAYTFLLYQPKSQEQAALATEIETLHGQQETLDAEIVRLEAIKADEPRMTADLARLDVLVPSRPAQDSAFDQLQGVAGRTGATIQSITFADPVAAAPPVPTGEGMQLGVIATTIVLEGGYDQAVAFVRALEEDLDRAVLVQNVAIAEGVDTFPSLSTTLTASIFSLIPADAASTAAATPSPSPAPSPETVQ